MGAERAPASAAINLASRLDLTDGRRVFVKAALDADDARYGWGLSEAYSEEIRKLRTLPSELPALGLLWTADEDIADMRWVILCFEYVDGVPPRRPGSQTNCVRSFDTWLATLWLYSTTSMEDQVPTHSPDLRDHQAWCAEATEDSLRHRLGQ